MDELYGKKLAVLTILAQSREPLKFSGIVGGMANAGHHVSERTLRSYLQQLDAEGLVLAYGKKGRAITEKGRAQLGAARVLERVGYMSARIDRMSYSMSFDLALRSGTVVVNTAVVSREALERRLDLLVSVFEKNLAMGALLGLLEPGETAGDVVVGPGMVGMCTVCSVTLNGVFLKHGIPTRSLFSGLLELMDGEPIRFSELINYDGITLDPLELFIRGGMTDYVGAVTDGNGRIGAGFREVPADCCELVEHLADQLVRIGLGGFLRIGRPGQEVFNIPVPQECCGAVVIGGMSPLGILEETGEIARLRALSGLMEFNRLFHYSELPARLKEK